MTGGAFEALNYALRKSKDGVIVSFVVHPSDVDSALTALPIGARVEIKWAEINDDETPKGGDAIGRVPATSCETAGNDKPPHAEQSATHGARKLSEQCALRCKDKRFWEFLESNYPLMWRDYGGDVVDITRRLCSVASRSALDSDAEAASDWRDLEKDFQSWLVEQMHAGLVR